MKKLTTWSVLISICVVAVPFFVTAQVSAPTNLTTAITGLRYIRVMWSAPAEAVASYQVYRDDVAVATTTAPEYTDNLVTLPGSQHCYKLRSYDAALGYSDLSSSICNSVVVGTASPPTGLIATIVSSNSIKLDWTFSLTDSQQLDDYVGRGFYFIIERSPDNGTNWSIIASKPFEIEDESSSWPITYTDTQAVSGGSNTYRVTTLDWEVGGFSVPSGIATAAAPQVESVPTAPSNLTFAYTNQPTTVSFTWNDNSNDEKGWFLEKKSGDSWAELFKYAYPNTGANMTYTVTGLSLGTTYEVRVRTFNAVGNSEPSNIVTVVTAPDVNLSTASNGVLCVYNLNLQISKDICDYYLLKRPGSLSKGLDIPDSAFHQAGEGPTAMLREDMTIANFTQYVLTPLGTYVRGYNSSHPESPINYLAIAKGLPVRDSRLSVMPFYHHSANQTLNEYFRQEGIAASFLMGFTLADVQKMIDKAQAPAPDLSSVKWFFDLDDKVAAGPSVLGDKDSLKTRSRLMSLGVVEQNVVTDATNANPLSYGGTVVGYAGLGTHHNQDAQPNLGASPPFGYPSEWAKRSVNMPVANRAIIDAYESYYALSYHDRPQGQGLIAHAMTPTAFGGSNYSRSFAGGVGTVSEPGGPGVVQFEMIFPEYMKGHTWAQSFKIAAPYTSHPMGMVVGDPIMTIRDGGGLLTGARINVKPTIFAGVDRSIPGPAVQLAGDVLDKGYPESSVTTVWTKESGPGTVTFSKRVSSYAGDLSALVGTATFSTAGTYVLRLTGSNGALSEYDDVTMIVTTGSDTTPPVIQTVGPTGTLASNTTSVSLSITTDEDSTCRYSTVASAAFGSSQSTLFSSTGGKSHTHVVTGLSSGTSYTYYARCRDSASNANTSDYAILFAVAAVVPEIDTVSPSVTITYPASQSLVYEGQLTITASAADLVGVSGVKFYVDGSLTGSEDTAAPYSKSVSLSAGTYRVYAIARDAAGNTQTSTAISFTVRKQTVQTIEENPRPPVIPTAPPVVATYFNDPTVLPAVEQARYVEYVRSTYTPPAVSPQALTSAPARISKNLKLNDQGEEVRLLQKTLNLLGYSVATEGSGSLNKEGSVFDERTKKALMEYQRSYAETGVEATGVLDNVTLSLLNNDIDQLVNAAEILDESIVEEDGDVGLVSRFTHIVESIFEGVTTFLVGLFGL